MRRPPRGRARVGQAVGKAKHPDHAPTAAIPHDVPTARPVFVDPSGKRRHRQRLLVSLLGLLLVLAVVAIWVSQLTGPAGPPPGRAPCPSAASAAGSGACG